MVSEDDDGNLGVVWVLVAVLFDYQLGNGWDGAGCIVFASEATIIFLVYYSVDKLIEKALFLLLISL